MSNLPIVLVISEGAQTPEDIISNIRKVPTAEDCFDLENGLKAYKYHMITKYYEIDISFVPFREPLSLIPATVQGKIEGLLVYFNANNKSFLSSFGIYSDFVESNDIELGILLCDKLFDDEKDGITYIEVKTNSKLLDVIELDREKDDNRDEENIDHHDPIGYDEVLQTLKSFLWSNIEMSGGKNGYKPLQDHQAGEEMTEETMEAEMAVYEDMLGKLMFFKNSGNDMPRTQRLAFVEKFAEMFDDLMCMDEDGGTTSVSSSSAKSSD